MPTLKAARERIARAYDGKPPKVLDMFAGGGQSPWKLRGWGCDSYALDYNPVAHLIELCTLVYPQTFGVTLASDVDKWGQDVLKKVHRDVLDLYPTVTIPKSTQVAEQVKLFGSSARSPASGSKCEPVSYIWVRTVPCRRPGCPAIVPLVRQACFERGAGTSAPFQRRAWREQKLIGKSARPRPLQITPKIHANRSRRIHLPRVYNPFRVTT